MFGSLSPVFTGDDRPVSEDIWLTAESFILYIMRLIPVIMRHFRTWIRQNQSHERELALLQPRLDLPFPISSLSFLTMFLIVFSAFACI
jgi:hypothetical protein